MAKDPKKGERKDAFQTLSGIRLEPVYEESAADPTDDIGLPGAFPFTRGVQPTMYRGRLWTMRQYAGFGSAEETNARFRYLLENGQTGLSCAFDLPTQMGLDPDSPRSTGEVGRVGVSIASIQDMRTLTDAIPLDEVSTSMTINATAAILLCFYQAVAEERGIDPARLRGTIQNDILKEYTARGTYVYPPAGSMKIITDIFAYAKDALPRWNVISISGYHMREAGCTAPQEIAFTLAHGIAYVQAAVDAGLDVDAFAGQLSFFFNVHNDFLEEIAKFRAARRLWARIMRERFGAQKQRSWTLKFHAQTAGSSLTAQQPKNNVVRVALQALAAVLGGAQSIHTNSLDEALGLPTEETVRTALRTQQIIAEETGVPNTVDPVGGAHAIETLTDVLEARAREYIQEIDELGGAVAAIEKGYTQRQIEDAAYAYQKAVDARDYVVVGVNDFVAENEPPLPVHRLDPELEKRRIEALRAFRAARKPEPVETTLATLEAAARADQNVVPAILACVKADVTLGEISDRLRQVFGEYTP